MYFAFSPLAKLNERKRREKIVYKCSNDGLNYISLLFHCSVDVDTNNKCHRLLKTFFFCCDCVKKKIDEVKHTMSEEKMRQKSEWTWIKCRFFYFFSFFLRGQCHTLFKFHTQFIKKKNPHQWKSIQKKTVEREFRNEKCPK